MFFIAPASDDTDNHLLELYSIPDSVTSSTLKSRVSAYVSHAQITRKSELNELFL